MNNLERGIAAGLFASIPQVFVTQGVTRLLRLPEERAAIGPHVFGCDICQDVCPWNQRAPVTGDPAYAPQGFAPPLEEMASQA